MKMKEFEKYKQYQTRNYGNVSLAIILLVFTFGFMGLSLLLLDIIDKDIQYPMLIRYIIGFGPGLGVMFYIQYRIRKRGARNFVDIEIDCIRNSIKPHITGNYKTDVLNRLHSLYNQRSPLGEAEYYFEYTKYSGIALYTFQSLSQHQLTEFMKNEVSHYYNQPRGTTFLILTEDSEKRVKEIIDYELNTINTDYVIVLYDKSTNSFYYKKPAKYYITPLKIVKELDYKTIFDITKKRFEEMTKEEQI